MFDAAAILSFYAETPVHPGAGSTTSEIDLPLQREVHTGLPLIQSTSAKGVLKAAAGKGYADKDEVFGASDSGGALSPTDARLLLFPLRSLDDVFVWATCSFVIERLRRDIALVRGSPLSLPPPCTFDGVANRTAWVATNSALPDASTLVFEDEDFKSQANQNVNSLANELVELFPNSTGYEYFHNRLKTHLVVLSDGQFANLTRKGSSVVTRIRLNESKTTTGGDGNMWTEELLPADALLYSILLAMPGRKGILKSGTAVLTSLHAQLASKKVDVLQVGGDESAGRGWVRIHWAGGFLSNNGGSNGEQP